MAPVSKTNGEENAMTKESCATYVASTGYSAANREPGDAEGQRISTESITLVGMMISMYPEARDTRC